MPDNNSGKMLLSFYKQGLVEAGCDEAGRGCLAGSLFAAAVILPADYRNDLLNDSKQLSEKMRYRLRDIIEREALAYCVAEVSCSDIDNINILNASILGMHRALDGLSITPGHIIVDGNRFKNYYKERVAIPHTCIVKGDAKYLSIAAASVLAKTYRDDYMKEAAEIFPGYGWERNMGYPTKEHREAISRLGITSLHRKSFRLLPDPALF